MRLDKLCRATIYQPAFWMVLVFGAMIVGAAGIIQYDEYAAMHETVVTMCERLEPFDLHEPACDGF